MASECSTSHMTPHIYWFLSTRTGSRHRLWNSLVLYLGEIIAVQPVSTRRLALDFTSCYRFSIRFQSKEKKEESSQDCDWLAKWLIDVEIYGSKVVEGFSTFQCRSCYEMIKRWWNATLSTSKTDAIKMDQSQIFTWVWSTLCDMFASLATLILIIALECVFTDETPHAVAEIGVTFGKTDWVVAPIKSYLLCNDIINWLSRFEL